MERIWTENMTNVFATATEMQNNFGKYLGLVIEGKEIVVTKNGKVVGRFIPQDAVVSFLSDSLAGVLGQDSSDSERHLALEKKYGSDDRY